MWGSLLTSLLGPVANFFTRRTELAAQSHQLQLQIQDAQAKRQIDLIAQGKADDAAWERQALVTNAGWRGSFELLVLTVPVVLCFIPGMDVYVSAGFASLAKTPAWFQWLFVTVYCANYGIRLGGYGLQLWRRTGGGPMNKDS